MGSVEMMPGEEPGQPAELRTEQRQHQPGIAAEHHRVQPPRHPVELVEREEPAYEREREQPPAAYPDDPQHDRQEDQRDEDPRDERAHAMSSREVSCAEAAAADRVLVDRGPQVVGVEVRPERVGEDELRIRGFPEQEVREP